MATDPQGTGQATRKRGRKGSTILCEPTTCPNDPAFDHDNYYGCVPKDFSTTTGRSKTHRQTKGPDGRYQWNGGCDATGG